MPGLLLASRSPYRAKILTDAGIAFCVAPADIDEQAHTQADPVERAVAIATAKAEKSRSLNPDTLTLGVDQVVYEPRTSDVFGKPRDSEDHVRRLVALGGRCHDLVTGYALVGPHGLCTGSQTTRIWMRTVSEAEITAYVATGEGAGCAGGYAAEGRGGFLIERVEGDWFNVIGLPLYAIWSDLRRLGWRFDGSE